MLSCFLPYINVISYRCTSVPSLLNLPSTFHPIPLLQVVTEHQVELPMSGSKFHQAPLSMKFSRQEYWSRLPFRSPEDLPNTDSNPSPIILTVVEIRSQEWILQGYNHRVSTAVFLPKVLGQNLFLVSSSFQRMPAFFCLQLHHSNPCFHHHISLSDSCSPSSLFHF